MLLLNKGTVLYRVTEKFENYVPKYDNDTGKTGLYFANYQALPLSMVLEYEREEMILCTYVVTEDIVISSMGKYDFRNLDLSIYYTENGKMRQNVLIPDEHNVSHFDSEMYPIIYDENKNFLYRDNFDDLDKNKYGEVFLSKNDLLKIKLKEQNKCFFHEIDHQFQNIDNLLKIKINKCAYKNTIAHISAYKNMPEYKFN